MIRGYPDPPSVLPGGTLTLHVSSDRSQFRVEFYRQGRSLTLMDEALDWQTGYFADKGPVGVDWCWPCYAFTIPDYWQSGVYIARFIEGDGKGHPIGASDVGSSDGPDKALFVVKSAAPGESASILYKIPLFTYHAYACATDTVQEHLYDNIVNDHDVCPPNGGTPVTLHRPGGGAGTMPAGEPGDFYDRESFPDTFEHFDAKFVRWLEMKGYKVDYCTDLDVHENPDNFLASYRLLLIGGHDEYWSEDERENVERFVHNGGNLAIFSGNTCWYRVHVEDGNTAIRCDKANVYPRPADIDIPPEQDAVVDHWFIDNRENSLTGVSYRHGGSVNPGEGSAPVGYTVQHADHWVFAGTGLSDGDIFGAEQHLILWEFDGALFSEIDSTGYKVPTGSDGTPPDFIILGFASSTPPTATMGLYVNGGIVFNAATITWARVLASGEPSVDIITGNVLNQLGLRAVRIVGPLPTVCGRAVAVEGRTASFQVDTRDIGDSHSLSYQWSASAGEASVFDQPVFEATMPSPPSPGSITVTITITDSEGQRQGFGTLTFVPLTVAESLTLEILCLLRNITPLPEGVSIEDGSWQRLLNLDPVRFARKFHFDKKSLEVMVQKTKKLSNLVRSLMKLYVRSKHQ